MMQDHITPAQKAISPFFPGFWECSGWGFGGAVTTVGGGSGGSFGSYGWVGGFGTGALVDPMTRTVVLVLPQRLMRGADDTALINDVQAIACNAEGT